MWTKWFLLPFERLLWAAEGFLLSKEFLGTLFGAWAGAYFAYRYVLRMQRQQRANDRAVLFALLRAEFQRTESSIGPVEQEPLTYLPITLSAPDRLLRSGLLDSGEHQQFKLALLSLESEVAQFNNCAASFNLAGVLKPISHGILPLIPKVMDARTKYVIEAWHDVWKAAPEKERPPKQTSTASVSPA